MIIKNSDNWRDHEHWWEVERWKSRERGRGGREFSISLSERGHAIDIA